MQAKDVATLAYEAAAGEAEWSTVGASLRGLLRANSCSLWTGDPESGEVRILFTEGFPDGAGDAYAQHYVHGDRWSAEGARRLGQGIFLGPDLWDPAALRASEFYNDYARGIGIFHLVGTVAKLDAAAMMPMGVHRREDDTPFGEAERRVMARLAPHVARALRMERRMAGARLPALALDALPVATLVVDRALRVRHANAAAERQAGQGAFPMLRADRHGRPQLAPRHPGDAAPLAALVGRVAAGLTPAGELPLRGPDGAAVACAATPLARGGAAPGLVVLLLRDLAPPPPPDPARLVALYGLTPAEAAVAAALAGGATAAAVAASRRVGLETVRSQARAALEKTGAANLRALARLLNAG